MGSADASDESTECTAEMGLESAGVTPSQTRDWAVMGLVAAAEVGLVDMGCAAAAESGLRLVAGVLSKSWADMGPRRSIDMGSSSTDTRRDCAELTMSLRRTHQVSLHPKCGESTAELHSMDASSRIASCRSDSHEAVRPEGGMFMLPLYN